MEMELSTVIGWSVSSQKRSRNESAVGVSSKNLYVLEIKDGISQRGQGYLLWSARLPRKQSRRRTKISKQDEMLGAAMTGEQH